MSLSRSAAFAIVIQTFACGYSAAQEAKLPRVGFLANTIPTRELVDGTTKHPAPRAVVDGLRALGWVDGKNVRFVWRSAENDLTRLPALVDQLLREGVDVIVAYSPGSYEAIRKTETVPIVMATSVVTGPLSVDGKLRIHSLAKPGGNVTGIDAAFAEMARQRIDAVVVATLPITHLAPTQASIHRAAERHRMIVLHQVLTGADTGG